MKAKEYAKRFLDNSDKESAYCILGNGMMNEFVSLVKIRKAKAPRAVVAIVLEQNRKWNKIRELVAHRADLTEAGFYGICAMALESWPVILPELPLDELRLAKSGLAAAKALKNTKAEGKE